MQEKIDIFNDKYELIGTASKKEAHQKGLWHRVFTCLLVNPKHKTILLQKKVPGRYAFNRPDYLDISVGGHYKSGESISQGVRELKEEIGIKVKFKDLIPIGIRQTAETISKNYIANEFQHVFIYPTTQKLEDYKLDNTEVNGLVEINIQDGIDLLLKRTNKIKGRGLFIKNNKRNICNINITRKDFVPSYLKKDQFFLRLFIAAKRYLRKENKSEIFI